MQRRGVGRAHARSSPARRSRRRSAVASGCRPTGPTSPTSAARSTTSPGDAVLRDAPPRPRSPQFRDAVPTSWSRSSPPPAVARWRCSRAGRRWTTPSPPSGPSRRADPDATRPPQAGAGQRLRGREETCLFATTGLFQGVDVPGATLSLVVIDKLPFPRPDDPLLSARRELLGAAAFGRDRRPPGGDDAGPGVRPADPHRRRPRRRRGARSTARHRPLPVGHRAGAAADAAHPPPAEVEAFLRRSFPVRDG